jgi:metal-dependent amidase/aminoacylase/carboxypeptidase family protein
MMHGSDGTTVDGKSLALNLVDFVVEGKAAHAAIAPEKGISALDAVLMTFNGVEYLREHVRSDVRLHGVITDGGKAANIVPERAAAQFYIRASDRPYLDTVVERVYNVARAGALATGARLTINEVKAYDNKFNVSALNTVLLDNAKAAGATGITPPRDKTGSTDFSCVTYRVPGACLRVQFVPPGSSSHSAEWVKAAKEAAGHQAMLAAAKAVAAACYELAASPDLLKQIKAEFYAAKSGQKK